MDAAPRRHPHLDALAARVRSWTRERDPAGYWYVAGRYGWYRQDELPFGMVTLRDDLKPDTVPAALAESRCHFPTGPLTVWVETRSHDAYMRGALHRAGAKDVFEARYIAHCGTVEAPAPLPDGLRLVTGDECCLDDFVRVKQQAFMSTEHLPSEESLRQERARRLGELRHNGGLLMAYDGHEAVAGLSFFRVGPDRFLNLLVTRVPYRNAGVGRALVDTLLHRSYAEGAEAVVVVPDPAVERLYWRAGFRDEVLWRRAYQLG